MYHLASAHRPMAVIVDYDAGNLRSVYRACRKVGATAQISRDPRCLRDADRIIFPGVGAAGSAMRSLAQAGLDTALIDAYSAGTPILGICLGLQICLQRSEENNTETLGIVRGEVRRFRFKDPALKVPHMGWNAVHRRRPHPVLAGLEAGDECYFVHAYRPVPADPEQVLAETTYGEPFCAALGHANLIATQFHPEKSGRVGLDLLSRFFAWDGRA